MSALEVCHAIQHSAMGLSIRHSNWMFPTIESVHIIGLALVVGSIMWLDFRLLGFTSDSSVTQVSNRIMPAMWWGFGIAVVSGLLLFASEAEMCYGNLAFRLKMLMLLLIGVNAICYELITARKVHEWGVADTTPRSAKFTAVTSLVLWCGVILAGRWIAYAGNN